MTAKEALERFIAGVLKEKDGMPQVRVFTFEQKGLRVSELSCWWPGKEAGSGSGVAWMRSDATESGAVLLYAEDFLLNYKHKPIKYGPARDDYDDPENESRWRLALALTGKTKIADSVLLPRKWHIKSHPKGGESP